MIITGVKEGPLSPTPKKEGTIIAGESIAAVDKFICNFFGFKEEYVKYLKAMAVRDGVTKENINIVNVNGEWMKFDKYSFSEEHYIQAGYGWHGFIDQI